MIFSPDISDFLYLLAKHEVKYMIVGGEAVIYYGHARLTGDIDIYYELTTENCEKLFACLDEFWDNNIPGITNAEELEKDAIIIQFGLPPNRIDLINNIDGVKFDKAKPNMDTIDFEYKSEIVKINYIGIEDLILNKRKSDRNKDREDLDYLNSNLRKRK